MSHPKFLTKLGNFIAGRGYGEIANPRGKAFANWKVDARSEDASIWQAAAGLIPRVRDLFQTNELFQRYREVLLAKVFGPDGLLLRMAIKEEEDRVIHSAAEKAYLQQYERRMARLHDWAATRDISGLDRRLRKFESLQRTRELEYGTRDSALISWTGHNGSRQAKIKVGEPDLFANQLILRKWIEWQKKEFCDIRGTRTYHTIRQLRLIAAARDGDVFIRLIRDPSKRINKFGFAIQLIPAEFCDRWLNCTLPNGNQVRMGIEYEWTPWGLGKAVAFYFLKRQERDWQTWYNYSGIFSREPSAENHIRIVAEGARGTGDTTTVIHYCRHVDPEQTRPAPWVCAGVLPARQLSEATLYHVIAARACAKHIGVLSSDVPGMTPEIDPDPRESGLSADDLDGGMLLKLPPWVKFSETNPSHPSSTFGEFSQEIVRRISAALPGVNSCELSDKYDASFSASRMQERVPNAIIYGLQTNDIDYAEDPIFAAFLEMGLVTQEIPLPLAKIQKFLRPTFWGPRSIGVDAVKDINAAALRIANHLSTWTKESADMGNQWTDDILQKAEEIMTMEMLGIDHALVANKPMPADPVEPASQGDTTATVNPSGKSDEELAEEYEDANGFTQGETMVLTGGGKRTKKRK